MKKWMLITLIVIFSLVFLISLWWLIGYFSDSGENTVLYEDLSQMVEQARQTIPTESSRSPDAPTVETQDPYVYITDPETGDSVAILPEYAPIYQLNNDLVGWISIEDTTINYPVLQTPDTPNYYLNHNFEKKSSNYGAIYVQEACDVFAPSDNVVLYGHRMNDGSMFAGLLKYKDKAYLEAHPTIRFDTLRQRHTYQIISVFLISSVANTPFQYHLFTEFEYESQFETFMSKCKSYQIYDTGVTAEYGDQLITLSTCEKSIVNGRLVVVAKRIS